MVPSLVRTPVVVAVPEPMFRVPLLANVSPNSLLPFTDPMLPALVTPRVKVRVPEVEVTVVRAPMFERPETVKLLACISKVPAPPVVTKVPATVASEVTMVAVPPVLSISKLLKATPVIFWAAPPRS